MLQHPDVDSVILDAGRRPLEEIAGILGPVLGGFPSDLIPMMAQVRPEMRPIVFAEMHRAPDLRPHPAPG
jgi:hypothetical protein